MLVTWYDLFFRHFGYKQDQVQQLEISLYMRQPLFTEKDFAQFYQLSIT